MADQNGAQRELTKALVFTSVLFSLPFAIIFIYFGKINIAFGSGVCAATVITLIRMRADLIRKIWFWVTIFVISVFQIPIVIYIPWSHPNMIGLSYVPVVLLDGYLSLRLIKYMEKKMLSRL